MDNTTGSKIAQLVDELDTAVLRGDAEKADEIAELLYRLQGGVEEDAAMPPQFPMNISALKNASGRRGTKQRNIKRIVSLAAAAALVMTLGITALATHFFGLRDMVIPKSSPSPDTGAVASAADGTDLWPTPSDSGQLSAAPSYDVIPLQGYPDSNEYKASMEWELFRESYDTDGSIVAKVGNNPNAYTVKYPMYNVYSKEMADKLEEIIAKYTLKLHTSITIADSTEDLFSLAGVGPFLVNDGGVNRAYSGYVYNDGAFAYDGEAVLMSGAVIQYQLGNYVKGVFSDVCLNIGNADDYREWQFTTKSGVQVSLALSETKALVIADRPNSFVVINVLAGTGDSGFDSSSITEADLQSFADLFDFTQIN